MPIFYLLNEEVECGRIPFKQIKSSRDGNIATINILMRTKSPGKARVKVYSKGRELCCRTVEVREVSQLSMSVRASEVDVFFDGCKCTMNGSIFIE